MRQCLSCRVVESSKLLPRNEKVHSARLLGSRGRTVNYLGDTFRINQAIVNIDDSQKVYKGCVANRIVPNQRWFPFRKANKDV